MKNRRSIINFSVKRKMQIKLFANCMLIAVAAIAVMAALFYFYSSREIGQSYRQFHVEAKNFLEYLLPAVLGAVTLGVAASILIAVFFPHRIAGPLHRIETDLKEKLGEGDLAARFKLRKGDEVAELAEALNQTTDRLRDRIECIKKPMEALESIISQEKTPNDKELQRLVKEIGEAVRWFKT